VRPARGVGEQPGHGGEDTPLAVGAAVHVEALKVTDHKIVFLFNLMGLLYHIGGRVTT